MRVRHDAPEGVHHQAIRYDVALVPEIQLHVLDNDVDMNNTSAEEEATSGEVVRATTRLLTKFHPVLGLRPGFHKCVLLGTTLGVRKRLLDAMSARSQMQPTLIKVLGKKLGVQYTAQGRRLAALLRQRRQQAASRAQRISTLRTAIPRRARNQLLTLRPKLSPLTAARIGDSLPAQLTLFVGRHSLSMVVPAGSEAQYF